MGYLPHQLLQDFFDQQYLTPKITNEQIFCQKIYCLGRFRVTILAHKYNELTSVDEIEILIDLT